MTKVLGIKIGKNEIFHVLLEKNGDTLELTESGKINILQSQSTPELMATMRTELTSLLEKNTDVNKVVYHIYYDYNKDGIFSQVLPLGVLNLCCHDLNIAAEPKTKLNLTSKRFGGIPKNEILKSMDTAFPSMAYKNPHMRLIAALTTLGF